MKDKKEKKKSKKDNGKKEDQLFTLDAKEPSSSSNKKLTVVGNTSLNDVPTELPKKFFENILIEEMELSEEFTMNKFLSLVNLYSTAIEHYLVVDPSKAKLYQNRMEYLLTNKDTLIQLKKQKMGNKIEPKNEKEKNIGRKRKKTIQTVKMKTDELKFDDLSERVSKVISLKPSDKETVKNIIDDDIQKQNESWKEKLQNKKKNKSGLSSTFNKKKSSSDKSGSNSASFTDSPVISKKNSVENQVSVFNELYSNDKEKLEDDLGKIEEKEEENEEEIKKDENSKTDKPQTENEKSESKEVEDQKEENKETENKKVENEKEKKEEKEGNKERKSSVFGRKSIVEEDVIRQINVDDGVLNSVDEKIKTLEKLIKNININDNSNSEDEDQSEGEEPKKENDNNKIVLSKEKVPVKFQGAYDEVVKLMRNYMNKVNKFFYKDIFCMFSSELKELYELKCNKYIEIRNEYHQQIIENEYLLQNEENLNEEKKQDIQQTIDSLKEEQQHQIATIEDEFNRKILDKISEFKLNSFKKNSGIQLIEEQLKLNVYSIINDSFY